MIKQQVLFKELPIGHIDRIIESISLLPICEMGFLKRCGKVEIEGSKYFIKELKQGRVNDFKGNYLNLFKEYYESLNSVIETHPCYAILETSNSIIEIQPYIPPHKMLMKGNKIEFEILREAFVFILNSIDCLYRNYGQDGFVSTGIEPAIWNFSSDGKLYDFNPVRIYMEDCLFTVSEDKNMIDKTIYRNFSYEGMKANCLATILIGFRNKDFILQSPPKNWFKELKKLLIENLQKIDTTESKILPYLEGKKDINNLPEYHPLRVIL